MLREFLTFQQCLQLRGIAIERPLRARDSRRGTQSRHGRRFRHFRQKKRQSVVAIVPRQVSSQQLAGVTHLKRQRVCAVLEQLYSSSCTTKSLPFAAATCSGLVYPASVSAPSASKAFTAATRPRPAATASGVTPP